MFHQENTKCVSQEENIKFVLPLSHVRFLVNRLIRKSHSFSVLVC